MAPPDNVHYAHAVTSISVWGIQFKSRRSILISLARFETSLANQRDKMASSNANFATRFCNGLKPEAFINNKKNAIIVMHCIISRKTVVIKLSSNLCRSLQSVFFGRLQVQTCSKKVLTTLYFCCGVNVVGRNVWLPMLFKMCLKH